MLTYKTKTEISRSIEEELEILGLLNSSRVSIIQGMAIALSDDLKMIYDSLLSADRARRPSVSSGRDLEEFTGVFNVKRGIQNVMSDMSNTNFKFFISDSKMAKDITADGGGFTIPAGVSTTNGSKTFVTLDPAIFTPDSNAVYVRIASADSTGGTVEAGSLTSNSFSTFNLPSINPNTLATIQSSNDRPIIFGTSSESDNQLRSRLYSRTRSLNGNNEEAIKFELRSIGIPDAEFFYDFYGMGTLGVRLITGAAVLSDHVVSTANAIISRVAPWARAIQPEYITSRLQLQIEVDDIDNLETIQNNILSVITEFFDALSMGQTLNSQSIISKTKTVQGVVRACIVCLFINGKRASLNVSHKADRDQRYILTPDSPIEFIIGA